MKSKNLSLIQIPVIMLIALLALGTAACNNEPEPSLTGRVTIPQRVFLDDTVIANTNALRGSGDISYQWQVCDSAAGSFANIAGANGSSFHVTESASVTVGRFLRVQVTRSGISGRRNSNAVIIGTERPRAFIDFSGYSGPSSALASSQPPAAQQGNFTLANGITGSGLRLSHQGDSGAAVTISQHGGGMAAQGDDFLYFFIDHDIIRQAATVTLELTFLDNASGNFYIEYVRQGSDYYRSMLSRDNANEFVTKSIELDKCNFMAGHNQGAQFRFPGGIPIQKVTLISGGLSDDELFAPFTALNNMIGKGVAGYQAWFKAPGSSWHHWGNDVPGPGNVNVELWPAGMEDYLANGASLHSTNFKMHDNSAARLFNSHDRQIIRTHLKWMQDAGIDGAAIQRFFEETPQSSSNTGSTPNSHLSTIRDAAEEYGRIFYVMYDMSAAGRYNQNDVIRRIQQDWMYNIENKVISSPNYAQAEGKPVVCLWGVHANEGTDGNRYIKVEATIQLVQWFRDRGIYVIGGIPDAQFWRTDQADKHARGIEMYSSFDMISPWYIGGDVNSIAGTDSGNSSRLARGIDFCVGKPRSWAGNQPIAFMPTVWPGFAWTNMSGNTGQPNAFPRDGGQHVWKQIRGYLNHEKNANNEIKSIYLAMFDEYDEGTNWMKGGVDFFDIPLNQYFKTHSADGLWLSSDYYLRLAKESIDALKRKKATGASVGPLNEYGNASSVIVEHSLGPVYWRNSFERRTGRLKYGSGGSPPSFPVNHLQIDVGVPNGGVTGTPLNVNVSGSFTVNRERIAWNAASDDYTPPSATLGMVYSDAKSGGSSFRLTGSRTAGSSASYLYRIANVRIKASSDMALSYWIKTENPLGENVTVDLKLDNGAYLSDIAAYQNTGSPQNNWQQRTVSLPAAANGRYITEVIAAYRDSGASTGAFAAFIDDIIIMNN